MGGGVAGEPAAVGSRLSSPHFGRPRAGGSLQMVPLHSRVGNKSENSVQNNNNNNRNVKCCLLLFRLPSRRRT